MSRLIICALGHWWPVKAQRQRPRTSGEAAVERQVCPDWHNERIWARQCSTHDMPWMEMHLLDVEETNSGQSSTYIIKY
jgi:hypothetical protein